MAGNAKLIAIFPGTFDPITHGHLDIIQRAHKLVDQLIIGIGRNPEKESLFTAEERVELIRDLVRDLKNIRVEAYDGLTYAFAVAQHARVIIRGIRDSVDLRTELQAANTNLIVGEIETIFLMTSDQHALTSSSFIKQIVELGPWKAERLARLVPPAVAERLHQRILERRRTSR